MRADAHISVARAAVGTGSLERHMAVRIEQGRAFVLVEGIGAPRTWSIAMKAALTGFERGLAASGQRGADRLEDALFEAREELARVGAGLIERALPDAMIVSVLLDQGDLHVVSAGKGRCYVHRRGKPERLTAREEHDRGLLQGSPIRAAKTLEPEDIVLIGSQSSFSSASIEKLAQVLSADPKAPPSVVATILTEPAARAGLGAAAIALRVR